MLRASVSIHMHQNLPSGPLSHPHFVDEKMRFREVKKLVRPPGEWVVELGFEPGLGDLEALFWKGKEGHAVGSAVVLSRSTNKQSVSCWGTLAPLSRGRQPEEVWTVSMVETGFQKMLRAK